MTPQVTDIIGRLRDQHGPLLLVLRANQGEIGYIPAEAVPVLRTGLSLSRADVHGE